jgi:hypothetical protein
VLATLEPELQMAGFFGPGTLPDTPAPTAWPSGARTCGLALLWPMRPAIEVREGAWAFACSAQGGGARTGADMLLVRRAAATEGHVSPGALQLASHPLGPELAALLGAGNVPPAAPQPGEQRRELIVRLYYIARRADGDARTPALRVKSLSAVAGTPAFIDTEVMPGVENLQIELLPSPAAPRSARVHVRIVADAADQRPHMPRAALEVTRHFTLRNAPEA